MKYVSVDIETTGLDPQQCVPLELAAVLGDTKHLPELATLRLLIVPEDESPLLDANQWCKDNLAGLFAELRQVIPDHHTKMVIDPVRGGHANFWGECRASQVDEALTVWLSRNGFSRDEKDDKYHVNVAGKNVASFDLPFLKHNCPGWGSSVRFRHRVVDPTPFFAREGDEVLPDLGTCLERAGLASYVSHGALDDALQVHQLIQHSPLRGI